MSSAKSFDLEDRTFALAQSVRTFVKKLPRTVSNYEDVKQLVRSSGSVGANYIEANESLSRKDFKHRIRICRKEVKETRYWLRLVDCREDPAMAQTRDALIAECLELLKIFSAIIKKTE
ncbi:MAG: four helix bundle protein [Pirellulales bacterium]